MARLTTQEAFDIMVTHLAEQGAKAHINFICRYRAGTMKCAFGALIPDDRYSEEMEGKSADVVAKVYLHDLLADVPKQFCRAAQNIHDATDVSDWCSRFKQLAWLYDLDPAKADLLRSAPEPIEPDNECL